MKNTLYCEMAFLSDFFQNRPRETNEAFFSETNVFEWKNYSKLILQDSKLFLNISESEFANLPDDHPLWKMMKKKKMAKDIEIEFMKFPDLNGVEMETYDKSPIFLISDDEKASSYEKVYGYLFISNKRLFDWSKVLFSNDNFRKIKNYAKGGALSFDSLSDFKHPCNFIKIIDPYFFKREEEVKTNLTRILKSLLPDEINRDFNITIKTKQKNISNHPMKSWDKNELQDYVCELAKSIRGNIMFKVTILFSDNADIHDRHMITNYMWFSSGYGFILDSDRTSTKTTDIHIHRITSPGVKERMTELLK